jgi:2-succinyl-5-enolpyruvyl-6-hydroxy-3-cyclohexene-1-carboxylate synthase
MSKIDGVDTEWLSAWRHADAAAVNAIEKLLGEQEWPTGLRLAMDVMESLPADAALFLGSSNPVRDIDLVADPRSDVTIYANRGVAGIDGNVSTAAGMALAVDGPAYALIGDLTLLHDLNGLLVGPPEQRPNLTLIVHNDDGGGIFTLLEQGAAEYKHSFERIFGTPHGADIEALCRGYRVDYVHAESSADLRAALKPGRGLKVVEVRSNRGLLRDLHARLRAAVTEAALR